MTRHVKPDGNLSFVLDGADVQEAVTEYLMKKYPELQRLGPAHFGSLNFAPSVVVEYRNTRVGEGQSRYDK